MGLDEDTAAIVYPNDTLEVIGKGAVTIVDGSEIITDAAVATGHQPMMVSGVKLHSLPQGYCFDLRERRLLSAPHDERSLGQVRSGQRRLRNLVRQVASEGADSRAPFRSSRYSKASE
jgi:cyanophycinase